MTSTQPFQGEASHVRCYPFAMKQWETRIMYRACERVVTALNDGQQVELGLPLWFRIWLWMRTVVARLR